MDVLSRWVHSCTVTRAAASFSLKTRPSSSSLISITWFSLVVKWYVLSLKGLHLLLSVGLIRFNSRFDHRLVIYVRVYVCMYVCIYLSIYIDIDRSVHVVDYLNYWLNSTIPYLVSSISQRHFGSLVTSVSIRHTRGKPTMILVELCVCKACCTLKGSLAWMTVGRVVFGISCSVTSRSHTKVLYVVLDLCVTSRAPTNCCGLLSPQLWLLSCVTMGMWSVWYIYMWIFDISVPYTPSFGAPVMVLSCSQ